MSLRRWIGSWRVAARIARRDAVRDRGRTALVVAMVGLPVLVGAAGGTALASSVTSPARELSWSLRDGVAAQVGPFVATSIEQLPDGKGYSSATVSGDQAVPTVTEHEAALAALLPAGDRLVRGATGLGRVVAPRVGPAHGTVTIQELPAADLARIVVPRVATGALPARAGQVALSASTAAALGLAVGDTMTLRPRGTEPDVTVQVSGVLVPWPRGGDVIATSGALLPPVADARTHDLKAANPSEAQWYVLGTAPVTWDVVRRINTLGGLVTSRAVLLDPPPAATGSGAPTSSRSVAMVAGVAAIALIEAVLVIGPAFAVGARRSRRQLALLAASGADGRTLRRVVLASGLWIGLAASVAGVTLGVATVAVTRWVLHLHGSYRLADLRVQWWLPLVLLALATTVSVAAAVLPARSSARLSVVEVLAGRRAEATVHPGVPIAGLVLAAAGLVAAVVGSTTARSLLVVAGIVALELGVVLAAGGIVVLAGRFAPRLRLAGRFALRDAVRQRSRTAPALAAVLAALAGVTAGLVYVQSAQVQRVLAHEGIGVPGTVAVATGTAFSSSPSDDAQLAPIEHALRADLPVDAVATVHVAVAVAEPTATPQVGSAPTPFRDLRRFGLVDVVRAPDQVCPGEAPDAPPPVRTTTVDPRCTSGSSYRIWDPATWGRASIVDDGTAIRLLRLPGSERAAAALAAGKVVVRSVHDLQPDGTVRVEVGRYHEGVDDPEILTTADFPAEVVDLRNPQQFGLVLPPAAAQRLGVGTRAAGLVASTTAFPTQAQVDAASMDSPENVSVIVEPRLERQSLLVWLLVGAALVVGLGATGLALGLSAAETKPDLATLAALGAAPRLRRRIAAAQAGVVVVTGTLLGVGTGLLLGTVLVRLKRFGPLTVDPTWSPVLPWPALAAVTLGVPAFAMGAAWLLTRSRLPMVRRVVG